MITVVKQNIERTIEDTEIDQYLADGYSVIDKNGNVLKVGSKESTFDSVIAENKRLRRENEMLKVQLLQKVEETKLEEKPEEKPKNRGGRPPKNKDKTEDAPEAEPEAEPEEETE